MLYRQNFLGTTVTEECPTAENTQLQIYIHI